MQLDGELALEERRQAQPQPMEVDLSAPPAPAASTATAVQPLSPRQPRSLQAAGVVVRKPPVPPATLPAVVRGDRGSGKENGSGTAAGRVAQHPLGSCAPGLAAVAARERAGVAADVIAADLLLLLG